jgi:outer membrane PBP1 activator LpoA protein
MSIAQRLTPLFIALTLAGCASQSARHREAPLIQEADRRFRAGDFEGAAQIYQRLAENSDDADYFRLLAADAELRAGDERVARVLLGAIDPNELESLDQYRYALLRARVELNEGRAKEAMARLEAINYGALTTPLRAHYHTLRASAYNQMGNMLESARERVFYGQFVSNPEALQRNDEFIYDALRRLPEKVLTGLQPMTSGTLGGWMALVTALRAPAADRDRAIKAWRASHYGHPAGGEFLDKLLHVKPKEAEVAPAKPAEPPPEAPKPPPVAETPPPAAEPAQTPPPPPAPPKTFIGVMLPLSGSYAPAGLALREGMTAAAAADADPAKPELRFVDTQGGDVAAIYRQFAQDGARFVIGPLLKEEVSALGKNAAELPVPILALNQVTDVKRDSFYQFALTPEQEVEQAAGSAWFDGLQNAMVLAPQTPLGQRLINHFSGYWKSLGGKIAGIKTYQPGAADYAGPVRELLGKFAVQPGQPEGSAPPPAPAATGEFVFLVADARDARLLRPYLEFEESTPIPVYATSQVFDGAAAEPRNQDLNGVIFCDAPWLLNDQDSGPTSSQALREKMKTIPENYLRLLPMGLDAYGLIPQLEQLRQGGQNRYNGAVGALTVRDGNRIQRQLHCAKFGENGLQPRGIAPVLQPAASNPP